jgi:hypothetical protein
MSKVNCLPNLMELIEVNRIQVFDDALKVSTNKSVPAGTAANRNISIYNGKDLLSAGVVMNVMGPRGCAYRNALPASGLGFGSGSD